MTDTAIATNPEPRIEASFCAKCNRNFTTKSGLDMHILRVHKRMGPQAGVPAKVTHTESPRANKPRHMPGTPGGPTCPYCSGGSGGGYQYKTDESLRLHLRRVHREKPAPMVELSGQDCLNFLAISQTVIEMLVGGLKAIQKAKAGTQ